MDIDATLRQLLEDVAEETECIKGSLIKDLKNPRYTSGRLIKDGDRPLMVLEYNYDKNNSSIVKTPEKLLEGKAKNKIPTLTFVPRDKRDASLLSLSFNMIILHEDEIKDFCKKYLYVSSDLKTIRVVKKPKNWI